MTYFLAPTPIFRAFDSNGLPLAGGLLYTYVSGTTTPQATYRTPSGPANANPVVLDANGECILYLDQTKTYTFLLKSAAGVTQPNYPQNDIVTVPESNTMNIKDFGAACDGVTADDDALDAGIAAAVSAGKTLVVQGTPLLKRAHTITSRVQISVQGGGGVDISRPPSSRFVKHASVSGTALKFTGDSVVLDNLALECQAGNSGDGLAIEGYAAQVNHAWVCGAGRDGIRVGADAAGSIANSFALRSPKCWSNGRDGIRIESAVTPTVGSPDANAGIVEAPCCLSNGGRGIYCGNSMLGTVITDPSCEENAYEGLYFDQYARDYLVLGGDLEHNQDSAVVTILDPILRNLHETTSPYGCTILALMVQGKRIDSSRQNWVWTNPAVFGDNGGDPAGVGTYSNGRKGFTTFTGGAWILDLDIEWSAHTGGGMGYQAMLLLPFAVDVDVGSPTVGNIEKSFFRPYYSGGITLPATATPLAYVMNAISRVYFGYELDGAYVALELPTAGRIQAQIIAASYQNNLYQRTKTT